VKRILRPGPGATPAFNAGSRLLTELSDAYAPIGRLVPELRSGRRLCDHLRQARPRGLGHDEILFPLVTLKHLLERPTASPRFPASTSTEMSPEPRLVFRRAGSDIG